jgi:hypothetical protein
MFSHMRKYFYCFVILFLSLAAKAQQPAIDSVKIMALEKEINVAQNSKDFKKASDIAKQVIVMGVRDSDSYYLAAIMLCMAGKEKEGKLYYDTALVKGYDPKTEAANMLGLNGSSLPPFNLDSAFAAIHTDAIQSSKHLSKGVKNAKLYRLYIEDIDEMSLLAHVGVTNAFRSGLSQHLTTDAAERKKELLAMLPKIRKNGGTKDLEDAAFILQQEGDTTDYRNAHELVLQAIYLGDTSTKARQIAAFTLDRYLVKQGKLQRYGTQVFENEQTGQLELYPVDPSVTDEERAKWGEPPLKDALKRANAVYTH